MRACRVCAQQYEPMPSQYRNRAWICNACVRAQNHAKRPPKRISKYTDPASVQLNLWLRVWSYVEKGPRCWNWIGHLDKRGYGRLELNNGCAYAHRVVYELIHGRTELDVLHSCDNPACVRPDHLRAGTHQENMRDMLVRGRHGSLKKTHCPQGHPYEGGNLRIKVTGGRTCRMCRRCAADYQRRRIAERKSA